MWLPKKIVLSFHKRLPAAPIFPILSASIKSSVFTTVPLAVLIKTTPFHQVKGPFVEHVFCFRVMAMN
jgi:hypothetical protein